MEKHEELAVLEEVRSELESFKAGLISYINEKTQGLLDTVHNRMAELQDIEDDEDIEEDFEDDEEDFEDEEVSVEDRVRQSVLNQQIASQIAAQQNAEPVVVVPSAPTPSLSEIIKQQVTEQEAQPAVNLSELIANQVQAQQNLSVVAPETIQEAVEQSEAVETSTEPSAPQETSTTTRNMSDIIAELRRDVTVEVDASTEQATNSLVQQAGTNVQDLSKAIRQQVLSNEVKKQLS
ncbi:hypothetical protein COJ01_18040 [Priestia megaterium]|uniref:hypothetical protein n=1 Tax=Priestia megaterium TaxID=1404 RepID=UPI000BF73CFB|nr:hypothetical protein [Priestia megaterium]PFK99946.1 hypothetical protein COJ01_18040 [Priestia megaterium]